MKTTNIAFFAYAVSDMKESSAFYEGLPGLKPNSKYDDSGNPNWVEYDNGSGTLGIGCDVWRFQRGRLPVGLFLSKSNLIKL